MADIKKEEPKEEPKVDDLVLKEKVPVVGEEPKLELTKNELTALIQVVNQPRNQDLRTAEFFINLNNKLSKMVDSLKE